MPTDQIAQLRPLPGNGAVPTLTAYGDGRLIVGVPDEESTELRYGPGWITAIGSYSAEVPAPRRPAQRRLYRGGWVLLDGQGTIIAWLGNLDVEFYDSRQVREFATATGIEMRDLGPVAYSDLRAADRRVAGPGTSSVTMVQFNQSLTHPEQIPDPMPGR